MLLSSQNAPLHLHISRGYEGGLSHLNSQLTDFILMQNIHRVAMLKLRVRDAAHMPPHIGAAPLLHSFHLECKNHYEHGYLRPGHTPLIIPEGLICRPPRLRELVINAVLSQYDITALARDLTFLRLTIFSARGLPPRPSVDETVGIIQAAPNLEMLCIQRIWGSELDLDDEVCDILPRSPHSAPYPLQRLRSLRLLGSMDCVNFLDYFTFPPSVSVEVDRRGWESISPALLRSTHRLLSQLFLSSPIVSMVVGHEEYEGPVYDLIYCAELSPTDISRIPFYGRTTPRLRLNYFGDRDVPISMACLYNGLPLSHLHALHLECPESWNDRNSKPIIQKCFGSLPELHTITITESRMAIEMIPVLGQTAADGQAQVAKGSALLFPAVRALRLYLLEEKWTIRPPHDPEAPRQADVVHDIPQQLLHVLRVRKRYGYGIENLVLIECRFSTKVLARIRKIVGNVEVYSDIEDIIYTGLAHEEDNGHRESDRNGYSPISAGFS
ncbi:hypothetical protein AAF712_005851 [Marasmius tenuissimus]|uniref:F-box domain-containing protein n=1 Tax=Marasmius tenuissimus TaxID=585030 RepID=A0ABR3A185_9AGAR